MNSIAWEQLNLSAKRAAFPLTGPRAMTMLWWPAHVYAAAVAGYHEAFFAVSGWSIKL